VSVRRSVRERGGVGAWGGAECNLYPGTLDRWLCCIYWPALIASPASQSYRRTADRDLLSESRMRRRHPRLFLDRSWKLTPGALPLLIFPGRTFFYGTSRSLLAGLPVSAEEMDMTYGMYVVYAE